MENSTQRLFDFITTCPSALLTQNNDSILSWRGQNAVYPMGREPQRLEGENDNFLLNKKLPTARPPRELFLRTVGLAIIVVALSHITLTMQDWDWQVKEYLPHGGLSQEVMDAADKLNGTADQ